MAGPNIGTLRSWLTAGRSTMVVAAVWGLFDVVVHVVFGLAEVSRIAGDVVAIAFAGLAFLIASPRVNTWMAALAAFLVLGFNVTWLVGGELEATMLIGLFFAWVLLALLAWAASLYRDEARRSVPSV